jgi:hypothetical protein
MIFTVTYRSKTGARAEVEIEAANRAACMAECKRRGIAPIGIRERRSGKSSAQGGAGRAANVSAAPRGGTWRAAILAASVLAVVGGGLWWWFSREVVQPAPAEKSSKQSVAKPVSGSGNSVASPKRVARPAATNTPSAAVQERGASPSSRMYLGLRVISSEATTNNGVIVERLRTEDGKIHSIVSDAATPVFEHPTDEILASLPPADGTSASPPPPSVPDLDKRFAESLKTEIKILDTDTDDIRAMKQAVIELRAEAKKLLDQGLSMDEVLREHRRLAEENESMRRNVLVELKKMIAAGDESMALEYRKCANAALEQMGIAPVTMAVTADEKAERAEGRRERARERRKARESD